MVVVRATLDDACPQGRCAQEPRETVILLSAARVLPASVPEHEDVGPGERAAPWAAGEGRARAEGRGVHRHRGVGGEDADAAAVQALQVVDRAVALDDRVLGEPGALELAVDVRCEDEEEARPLREAPEDLEAPMRNRPAVELEPVAVEAPGELRVVVEPARAREVDEPQPSLAKRRVGLPEALVAPEVGQAGVDPHPGPGGDQEGLRFRDRLRCALDVVHGAILAEGPLRGSRGIGRASRNRPSGGEPNRTQAVQSPGDTRIRDSRGAGCWVTSSAR